MLGSHSVDLDVVGWGAQQGSARAEVVHYDFLHRLGRALTAVALVWLVAIPAMFIPWIALLVFPFAVALSAFLFMVRLRAPDVARVCLGTCPDCGSAQTFDMPVRFELPLHIECANCSRELTLEEHREARGA